VVTLRDWLGRRHDVLLGAYDSPDSRAEYRRVMIEWEANGRRLPAPTEAPADLTIAEMLVRYWQWAEQHYRDEQGQPSRELENLVMALKPLPALRHRGGGGRGCHDSDCAARPGLGYLFSSDARNHF
jgi:hypothetical protein